MAISFPMIRIVAVFVCAGGGLAAFSVLSGCGTPAPIEATSSQVLPASDLQKSLELARESEVTCADSHRCPENVGMVVAAHDNGVVRCTGSLVAPDLVLTSARCVTPGFQQESGACAERVRFLLPAIESRPRPLPALPAHSVSCSSVIEVGAHHALIRLESPLASAERAPLKIDPSGIKDGLWLKVAAIRSISERKPFGELRVTHCTARQKTQVFADFRDDFSPIAALSDCRLDGSAAGAPVLGGIGSIRAIVDRPLEPQAIAEHQRRFKALLGETPIPDFALAANLACIRLPLGEDSGARLPQPSACTASTLAALPAGRQEAGQAAPAQGSAESPVTPEILASAQAELGRRLARWQQSSGGQRLGWKMPKLVVSVKQEIHAVPACLAQSEQWLDEYRHWYLRGGYEDEAALAVQAPRFRVTFVTNSALQLFHRIEELDSAPLTVKFSPKQLAREKRTQASWGAAAPAAPLSACSR
jgi:hypothetical protein